jgi:hypothetical protein
LYSDSMGKGKIKENASEQKNENVDIREVW